jgi:hypothetical protein
MMEKYPKNGTWEAPDFYKDIPWYADELAEKEMVAGLRKALLVANEDVKRGEATTEACHTAVPTHPKLESSTLN